jgi:hypothetical protein
LAARPTSGPIAVTACPRVKGYLRIGPHGGDAEVFDRNAISDLGHRGPNTALWEITQRQKKGQWRQFFPRYSSCSRLEDDTRTHRASVTRGLSTWNRSGLLEPNRLEVLCEQIIRINRGLCSVAVSNRYQVLADDQRRSLGFVFIRRAEGLCLDFTDAAASRTYMLGSFSAFRSAGTANFARAPIFARARFAASRPSGVLTRKLCLRRKTLRSSSKRISSALAVGRATPGY